VAAHLAAVIALEEHSRCPHEVARWLLEPSHLVEHPGGGSALGVAVEPGSECARLVHRTAQRGGIRCQFAKTPCDRTPVSAEPAATRHFERLVESPVSRVGGEV